MTTISRAPRRVQVLKHSEVRQLARIDPNADAVLLPLPSPHNSLTLRGQELWGGDCPSPHPLFLRERGEDRVGGGEGEKAMKPLRRRRRRSAQQAQACRFCAGDRRPLWRSRPVIESCVLTAQADRLVVPGYALECLQRRPQPAAWITMIGITRAFVLMARQRLVSSRRPSRSEAIGWRRPATRRYRPKQMPVDLSLPASTHQCPVVPVRRSDRRVEAPKDACPALPVLHHRASTSRTLRAARLHPLCMMAASPSVLSRSCVCVKSQRPTPTRRYHEYLALFQWT